MGRGNELEIFSRTRFERVSAGNEQFGQYSKYLFQLVLCLLEKANFACFHIVGFLGQKHRVVANTLYVVYHMVQPAYQLFIPA